MPYAGSRFLTPSLTASQRAPKLPAAIIPGAHRSIKKIEDFPEITALQNVSPLDYSQQSCFVKLYENSIVEPNYNYIKYTTFVLLYIGLLYSGFTRDNNLPVNPTDLTIKALLTSGILFFFLCSDHFKPSFQERNAKIHNILTFANNSLRMLDNIYSIYLDKIKPSKNALNDIKTELLSIQNEPNGYAKYQRSIELKNNFIREFNFFKNQINGMYTFTEQGHSASFALASNSLTNITSALSGIIGFTKSETRTENIKILSRDREPLIIKESGIAAVLYALRNTSVYTKIKNKEQPEMKQAEENKPAGNFWRNYSALLATRLTNLRDNTSETTTLKSETQKIYNKLKLDHTKNIYGKLLEYLDMLSQNNIKILPLLNNDRRTKIKDIVEKEEPNGSGVFVVIKDDETSVERNFEFTIGETVKIGGKDYKLESVVSYNPEKGLYSCSYDGLDSCGYDYNNSDHTVAKSGKDKKFAAHFIFRKID